MTLADIARFIHQTFIFYIYMYVQVCQKHVVLIVLSTIYSGDLEDYFHIV